MPDRKTPRTKNANRGSSKGAPPAPARRRPAPPRSAGARAAAAKAPPRRSGAGEPRLAATAGRPAAGAVPNAIGLTSQRTDYTSLVLDEVRRFYTQVLGFAAHETDPQGNRLTIRLSPASSLGFAPPSPGPPELWRPTREPALTLIVRDVDQVHADLAARGVEFVQAPTDTAEGHRQAILRDPEGRTVCLAQPRQE